MSYTIHEFTEFVSASGNFDWLNAEAGNLYSVEYGEAVKWPSLYRERHCDPDSIPIHRSGPFYMYTGASQKKRF